MKEGKKTHLHNQTNAPQLGLHSHPASLQSNSQLKQQPHQPSPAGFIIPPVAPLESSQLLESSFESLPSFSQPHMHLSHHPGNSSSPAPPHLNTHPAGPVSPETHPFLNQQPILPSPGMAVTALLCYYCLTAMHNLTQVCDDSYLHALLGPNRYLKISVEALFLFVFQLFPHTCVS